MSGLKLLAVMSALLLAEAPDPRDVGPDTLEVSSFPPQYQEAYKVFSVRCSKCHSLARPINARLKGEQWKNYIKKMVRKPSSGINEETAAQIYEFLKWKTTRSEQGEAVDAGAP